MRNGQQVWANLPSLVLAVSCGPNVPIGDRLTSAKQGRLNFDSLTPGRILMEPLECRGGSARTVRSSWFFLHFYAVCQ